MGRLSAVDLDAVAIGPSAHMRAVFDAIPVVSAGDSPVLIVGEPGTGKELVARVVHQSSHRRRAPFVAVSCAGLSEPALTADLFGHERGGVPGATRPRAGRFERAQGGTLFLDDVDQAPPGVQARLTRVLQDRQCERLGATQAIALDLRIIAASRCRLRPLVAAGRFSDDLLQRLDVIALDLPPLRERREDVPVLLRHFVERATRRRGLPPPVIPPHVEHAFLRYTWPGNVRELENVCERLAQTCVCGTVRTGCIPPSVLFDRPGGDDAPTPAFEPPRAVSLDDRLREVEGQLIAWALRAADGNKSRAAELLHIKRTTLADRINRHGRPASRVC